MYTPIVSVIITTKNEEDHIQACLLSVVNQTYKNIEIIVVDNGSKDRTKDIVRRFTRYVYDKGPERSTQRNYGFLKSKGEYVLFLDADMILETTVVSQCVKVSEKYNAIIIPEVSFGEGFWAKCKILERSFYNNIVWMEAPRFYSAQSFRTLGGFDERLTGPEDFDLSERVRQHFGKKSIGRISSHIRHDEGRIKLVKLLQKKYYYGKNMKLYQKKQSTSTNFRHQASILARYKIFFRNPIKLFANPIVGLGMLLMKALEMAALWLGAVMSSQKSLKSNNFKSI